MSTPLPIAQSGSQRPLSASAIKKENQVLVPPSDARNRKRAHPEVIDLEVRVKKSELPDPFGYSYECDYSTESYESQSHSSNSNSLSVKAESPSTNLSTSSVNGKTSLVGYIVTNMRQFYEKFMSPIFLGDSFEDFQQKTVRNLFKAEATYNSMIMATGIFNTLVEFNRVVIFSDSETSQYDKNCCDLFRLDPLKLLDCTLDHLLGLLYFMNQVLKEKDPVKRREAYLDLWFDPQHGNRCAVFSLVPDHLQKTQGAHLSGALLAYSHVIKQLRDKFKYLETVRHHPRLPTSEKDVYFTSLNARHFMKFGTVEFSMKNSLLNDFKKHPTPFDE